MNGEPVEAAPTWRLTQNDIKALLAMWSGWYSLYRHVWFESNTFYSTFSIEVRANEQQLSRVASLLPPGTQPGRERNRIFMQSLPVTLAEAYAYNSGNKPGSPTANYIELLMGIELEHVTFTLTVGPLDLHQSVNGTLKLDAARQYSLVFVGGISRRSFHIQSLHQYGPGVRGAGRMVLHPLREGLDCFQDALSQASTSMTSTLATIKKPVLMPDTRRSYYFLCRDEHEASALVDLLNEINSMHGFASAGHIVLTNMDSRLDLPVFVSFLRVGRGAGLFKEESMS